MENKELGRVDLLKLFLLPDYSLFVGEYFDDTVISITFENRCGYVFVKTQKTTYQCTFKGGFVYSGYSIFMTTVKEADLTLTLKYTGKPKSITELLEKI